LKFKETPQLPYMKRGKRSPLACAEFISARGDLEGVTYSFQF